MKYGVRVRDIMASKPISISKEDTLEKAASLLKKHKIGALVVSDKDKNVLGILTEGDIVKRAFTLEKNPLKIKVFEVMSKDPVIVGPDEDLSDVTKIMNKKGIRRVPVVENEKLIGYLSEKDLLKIEPRLLDVLMEKLRVKRPTLKLRYRFD